MPCKGNKMNLSVRGEVVQMVSERNQELVGTRLKVGESSNTNHWCVFAEADSLFSQPRLGWIPGEPI